MPISAPRQGRRDQLQPQGRHAARLGRQLVVADRGEAEPERERSIVRAMPTEMTRQRHHQRVEVLDVAAAERRLRRPDDVDAARAADIIPVDDQRLHDDRQRQGRDREKHAAQPQASDSRCRARRAPRRCRRPGS